MRRSAAPIALFALMVLTTGLIGQVPDRVPKLLYAPGELKWVDNPNWPGRRTAVLFGSQQGPGMYIVRVRFPPNTLNPPHTHPDNRFVTVLAGTVYLGHGEQADKAHATKIGPGTFFTEAGGTIHYEYMGPDEVIVQVTGMGPTGTNYLKR